MYAQIDKEKENKSRAVANSVSQKKGDIRQGLGFVDNLPTVDNKKSGIGRLNCGTVDKTKGSNYHVRQAVDKGYRTIQNKQEKSGQTKNTEKGKLIEKNSKELINVYQRFNIQRMQKGSEDLEAQGEDYDGVCKGIAACGEGCFGTIKNYLGMFTGRVLWPVIKAFWNYVIGPWVPNPIVLQKHWKVPEEATNTVKDDYAAILRYEADKLEILRKIFMKLGHALEVNMLIKTITDFNDGNIVIVVEDGKISCDYPNGPIEGGTAEYGLGCYIAAHGIEIFRDKIKTRANFIEPTLSDRNKTNQSKIKLIGTGKHDINIKGKNANKNKGNDEKGKKKDKKKD